MSFSTNFSTKNLIDIAGSKNSAVVVLGGNEPKAEYLQKIMCSAKILVAADKGGEYCLNAGVKPTKLIGDFDSIDGKILAEIKNLNVEEDFKVEIVKFPAEKNATDGELASEVAADFGSEYILVIAADGDRFDHMLANILTFTNIGAVEQKIIFCFENSIAVMLKSADDECRILEINDEKSKTVSLLALSPKIECVIIKGFKYPLNGELKFGTSLGISNIIDEDLATVTIKNGILLVVINFLEV